MHQNLYAKLWNVVWYYITCINENIPFEEILKNEDDEEMLLPYNPNYPQAAEGLQTRNNIVNRYFL